MTRKRFVKLAMATGYSRNSANRIADAVVADGKTYAEVYKALLAVKKLTVAFIPALSEAVERFTKAASKMAISIGKASAAFAKAFQDSMAEE